LKENANKFIYNIDKMTGKVIQRERVSKGRNPLDELVGN